MADEFDKLGAVPVQDNQSQDPFAQLGAVPAQPYSLLDPSKVNANIGNRMVGDIFAGAGQALQSTANLPSDIARFATSSAQIHPQITQAILSLLTNKGMGQMGQQALASPQAQQGANFLPRTDIDMSSLFGVTNPNIADKALQAATPLATLAPEGAEMAGAALLRKFPGLSGDVAKTALPSASLLEQPVTSALGSAPGKLAQMLNPKKLSDYIAQSLGEGQGVEGNAKATASRIKAAADSVQKDSSELYQPIHDAMNGTTIDASSYDPAMAMDTKLSEGGFTPNLRTVNIKYLNDPSYDNAHKLQSDLGREIRSLTEQKQMKTLDSVGQARLENYTNYREALKNDIYKTADQVKPGLGDQYKNAAQHYYDNVTPYFSNDSLAEISSGLEKNPTPSAISKIFKSPSDTLSKVVEKSGIKNNILYNELGKYTPRSSADNFLKASGKLDEKGLGSYVDSNLQTQLSQLEKALASSKRAGTIGKWAAGTTAAGALGIPVINKLL